MKKILFLLNLLLVFFNYNYSYAVKKDSSLNLNRGEIKVTKNLQKNLTNTPTNLHINCKPNNLYLQSKDTEFDLWGDASEIKLLSEGLFDPQNNTFTFNGSSDMSNFIITRINDQEQYVWYTMKGQEYNFSGKLVSSDYAQVYPCIIYYDNESFIIMNNSMVILSEENEFTSDFNVSIINDVSQDEILFVGFIIENSSQQTTISSTNNNFFCVNRSVVAQKWSENIDLPGLGLNELDTVNKYTVLCEDGITTIGLYYNQDLYVTGINTTANEVFLPSYINIDNSIEKIDYFGYTNNKMNWEGAPNLSILHLNTTKNVCIDLDNSNITDLYISENCSFNNNYPSFSNINLHIPYGANRNNYKSLGFKRVLVGDEQPEYPEPVNSSWVIKGENKDEFYGISIIEDQCRIVEIFTEKDSVLLPAKTPYIGGSYYIQGIGADEKFQSGTLCKNAQNLNSIKIPDTYDVININWEENPIRCLYMYGNVPSTYWTLPYDITVYTNPLFYSSYINDYSWNNANILPAIEEEWITINVKRKGEFAQTYIEMTNADWDLGMFVKITGELNNSDLENIKKLNRLIKLDLSKANFSELPSSFLSQASLLNEVILPESITNIPSNAFYNCSELKKVICPKVHSIENSAFENCSKLQDFNIKNITTINENAFLNCLLFNPTELSSELKVLGNSAFSNTGITEVVISEYITKINSSVFSNCKQLIKVLLPKTIVSIDNYAFYNCSSLTDINIPEGIISINSNAFNGCSKIKEIILPSTLQSIGYKVFNNCSSITTIKSKAIVPPSSNGEFTQGIDLNHCTLYIAPFAIDAYREANDWNKFYIMKPLNEPVKNIFINRPIKFDLQSEDNSVLQENPNMTLSYAYNNYNDFSVGQLSAEGDGTLSAGIFSINHIFYNRNNNYDIRPTLVNNAENMRADSVVCTINFEKNSWHFISFQYDVNMKDIFGINNTDFVIRKYNGANRASGEGTSSNWEDVPTDGMLEAGKGYIIQAANNLTYENEYYSQPAIVRFASRNTVTKNKIFTSENVIIPLEEYPSEFAHNRSWNLIGNPYPCYYNMRYLMNDFTTPIVIWRGTSYQAYSPIDDDIILYPNEAFFVQRPLNTEQIVFGIDGRMHYNEIFNVNKTHNTQENYSKSTFNSNRSIFNFYIEGEGYDDRTRIVMNERALMEYEINCDACKFFAENSEGTEIYVDENIKYDICERPFADGIAELGIRVAKDGEYKISLSGHFLEGWEVSLKDMQTGNTIDLTKEEYLFETKAGIYPKRFSITFKSPTHTSIDNIENYEDNINVRIIDTTGITVYEGRIDEFKTIAKAGVYIVIDSKKTYKILIK